MEKKHIFYHLITLISAKTGIGMDYIREDSNFKINLGMDSLETMELSMLVEETFEVEIPDDDAINIFTVGAAVDYIDNKINGKTDNV